MLQQNKNNKYSPQTTSRPQSPGDARIAIRGIREKFETTTVVAPPPWTSWSTPGLRVPSTPVPDIYLSALRELAPAHCRRNKYAVYPSQLRRNSGLDL